MYFTGWIPSNGIQFILGMLAYSCLLHILFSPIILYLDRFLPHESINEKYEIWNLFILAVVLAPAVETFLFQFATIEILRKAIPEFQKGKQTITVAVSALAFASSHLGAYSYAFASLVGGVVLAQTYLIASEKKISPLICTFCVHSLRNLIVFTLSQLSI